MLPLKKETEAAPISAKIYDIPTLESSKRYTKYLEAFESWLAANPVGTSTQKRIAIDLYKRLHHEPNQTDIICFDDIACGLGISRSSVNRAIPVCRTGLGIITTKQVPQKNGFIYEFTLVIPDELKPVIDATPDNVYCINSNKCVKMTPSYIKEDLNNYHLNLVDRDQEQEAVFYQHLVRNTEPECGALPKAVNKPGEALEGELILKERNALSLVNPEPDNLPAVIALKPAPPSMANYYLTILAITILVPWDVIREFRERNKGVSLMRKEEALWHACCSTQPKLAEMPPLMRYRAAMKMIRDGRWATPYAFEKDKPMKSNAEKESLMAPLLKALQRKLSSMDRIKGPTLAIPEEPKQKRLTSQEQAELFMKRSKLLKTDEEKLALFKEIKKMGD